MESNPTMTYLVLHFNILMNGELIFTTQTHAYWHGSGKLLLPYKMDYTFCTYYSFWITSKKMNWHWQFVAAAAADNRPLRASPNNISF